MDKKRWGLLLTATSLVVIGIGGLAFGLSQNFHVPQQEKVSQVITKQSTQSVVLGSEGQEVTVTRVIDGDTIEIEGGQKVRYVGIDTPETVDPRRPVGCFGKEASDENKKLVNGERVILTKDVSETDKFDRLLRLVYLKQDDDSIIFINDYLVRQGFAKASTYPPDVKFTNQFLEAQREAQINQKGLWKKCLQ